MKTIPLTRGLHAMVDDEDFDMLNLVKWSTHGGKGKFYAYSRKAGFMHRYLKPVKAPYQIDHIDGNSLNNQRSNLRICTRQQNQFNRTKKKNCGSKYKGVSWHPDRKYWVSVINLNGKRTHLGVFEDEIEAAKAYDQKAKELFGEFAKPNF